ncbi:hypothetical protein M0805_005877 [Coniferiporia weirii]|nr:hypothetical protein M0805_005877 [Coniferiporia weirii]
MSQPAEATLPMSASLSSAFSFTAPYLLMVAATSMSRSQGTLKQWHVSITLASSPRLVPVWSFSNDTTIDSRVVSSSLLTEKKDTMRKARLDLSIQNTTALLVSLMNLSISCYPDLLEYVGQILGFASKKMKEFSDSLELHAMQMTNNLVSLLIAPINSYQSVLTLLMLSWYTNLLLLQPFMTCHSLAHAIIASMLKNETIIEMPEGLSGGRQGLGSCRPPVHIDCEEMAEEQGWVAKMVHLFRTDTLDLQFELFQEAQRHFEAGGERIWYTYPALIMNTIKLCRQYKKREHEEDHWQSKVSTILKFTHQLISTLFTQVEAPTIALQLFLLAAHILDECRFEYLTCDLYIQAFTMYEDSISDICAGLQAITLLAALHGVKLSKKPHRATVVHLASHFLE